MGKSAMTMVLVLAGLAVLPLAAQPGSALGKVQQKGQVAAAISDLRQIATGLLMYSGDNGDNFPDGAGAAGLAKLKSYGFSTAIFTAPFDPGRVRDEGEFLEINISYFYLGNVLGSAGKLREPSATPLLVEKPGIRKAPEVLVAYCDGHVGTVKADTSTVTGIITALRDQSGEKNASVWKELLTVAAAFDAKENKGE